METNSEKITIQATVNATIEKVWEFWNDPKHVTQWNNASPDWHTPKAVNDLQVGGKFSYTMAAKDGSFSFDFEGTYTQIESQQRIDYIMSDGRQVSTRFSDADAGITISTVFDPEDQNPMEMQREGWQSILDNFKRHTENN